MFGTKGKNIKNEIVKNIQMSTEVAELKNRIDIQEKKLAYTYRQIGLLYYNQNDSENVPEEYQELFNDIQDASKEIEMLSQKVLLVQNIVLCPNCRSECSFDMSFCGNCGCDLTEAKSILDPSPKCPECGTPISENALFCGNCGARLTRLGEESAHIATTKDGPWICSCGTSNVSDARFCGACGSQKP